MSELTQYYHNDLKKLVDKLTVASKNFCILKSGKKIKSFNKYDYVVLLNCLAGSNDIQNEIKTLGKNLTSRGKIIVIYFNFLWKPLLDFGSTIGFRKKINFEQNWLNQSDIENLFYLENYQLIKKGRRFIFPVPLGVFSDAINNFLGQLPVLNNFGLTTYQIFKKQEPSKQFSVSIIIPTRNEAGNIPGILKRVPNMGKKTEVIFVEGHSTDDTWLNIKKEVKKNGKNFSQVRLYKQSGNGKADAVRLGFLKAKNDILMILDADLTVNPSELPKFYSAISHDQGEFINGSRLIYPMEGQAMRTLNYLGNKIFSWIFTYLLEQKIKDTLCGTKVIFRKDYLRLREIIDKIQFVDPFGDFELLFGANLLNLKILEIPIKYRERKYGTTNISRFSHGWLLAKMAIKAATLFKFD